MPAHRWTNCRRCSPLRMTTNWPRRLSRRMLSPTNRKLQKNRMTMTCPRRWTCRRWRRRKTGRRQMMSCLGSDRRRSRWRPCCAGSRTRPRSQQTPLPPETPWACAWLDDGHQSQFRSTTNTQVCAVAAVRCHAEAYINLHADRAGVPPCGPHACRYTHPNIRFPSEPATALSRRMRVLPWKRRDNSFSTSEGHGNCPSAVAGAGANCRSGRSGASMKVAESRGRQAWPRWCLGADCFGTAMRRMFRVHRTGLARQKGNARDPVQGKSMVAHAPPRRGTPTTVQTCRESALPVPPPRSARLEVQLRCSAEEPA